MLRTIFWSCDHWTMLKSELRMAVGWLLGGNGFCYVMHSLLTLGSSLLAHNVHGTIIVIISALIAQSVHPRRLAPRRV
ncbi:hypothetical protein B0H34DRAFT_385788 [Crassisporium funariophilum]|nr:hypothetical protein B0H34DRAFT_385788 [Crassisporium funariophilum]